MKRDLYEAKGSKTTAGKFKHLISPFGDDEKMTPNPPSKQSQQVAGESK